MASSFDQAAGYKNTVEKMTSWGKTMRQHGLKLGYSRPWFYNQLKSNYSDAEKAHRKVFLMEDEEASKICSAIKELRDTVDYRCAEIVEYYFINDLTIDEIKSLPLIKKSASWTLDQFKTSIIWLEKRV